MATELVMIDETGHTWRPWMTPPRIAVCISREGHTYRYRVYGNGRLPRLARVSIDPMVMWGLGNLLEVVALSARMTEPRDRLLTAMSSGWPMDAERAARTVALLTAGYMGRRMGRVPRRPVVP